MQNPPEFEDKEIARRRVGQSECTWVRRSATNDEVFHNIDGVLETIRLKLIALRPRFEELAIERGATPLPNPPPQVGRE